MANSTSRTSRSSDQLSLRQAYSRYRVEHPDWSEEKLLTMASREDVNHGGDVVSAQSHSWTSGYRSGKKWAGTIGNTDYKYIGKLSNARKDAEAMGSQWVGEGFPCMNYTNKTGPGIGAAMREVAAHATPGSEINLYFAGHGEEDAGMCGVNADMTSSVVDGRTLFNTSDSCSYDIAGELASKAVSEGWHLKMIIDCCHSGAVAESVDKALAKYAKTSKITDYDIQTDEIRTKGLMMAGGRNTTSNRMEEVLFRQFVNHRGKSAYGKVE